MKRITLLLALVLCLVIQNQAQAQRRLPQQRGIQFTAGTTDGFKTKGNDGAFHLGAAMTSYTKNGNHWQFGGEFLKKHYPYSEARLPLAQFTVEGGYFLNFLSDGSKTLFFSLGASALAGYETVNWNDKLLPDGATIQNADAFLYGAALTLEMEIFLTDWAILLVNVRERMLLGSSVRKFHAQVGVGVKFIIH